MHMIVEAYNKYKHYLLYIALTQLFRIVSQRKKYVIVGVKFFVQCSSSKTQK